MHRETLRGGALVAFVLWSAALACAPSEPDRATAGAERREVPKPAVPDGATWAPTDARAPITTLLSSVKPEWGLRVEFQGAPPSAIEVVGPAPEFVKIHALEIPSIDREKRAFELRFAAEGLGENTNEVLVLARYEDATLAVGQALLR